MDEKYYRFWADFFSQAAEGRARFDMMRSMMEQAMRGGGEFFEMFNKWFVSPGQGTDPGAYQDAASEFTRAVNQFMSDFGVVPLSAYKDMEEKCKALRQRVEEQEEAIRRLRRMLAEKEAGLSEGTEWFTEMMKTQQQQFQKWTELFMPSASSSPDEAKGEGKE